MVTEYNISDLRGVPIIYLDRIIGDVQGVATVEGVYSVVEDGVHVRRRQIREYRANGLDDAIKQAGEEGLVQCAMAEICLTPPMPCLPGLTDEEARDLTLEVEEFNKKRTAEVHKFVRGVTFNG